MVLHMLGVCCPKRSEKDTQIYSYYFDPIDQKWTSTCVLNETDDIRGTSRARSVRESLSRNQSGQ